jgi:uncharacterized OsmC-like protein
MVKTVKAHVESTGNKLQIEAGARNFTITIDEPKPRSGDTGMNPVEALLCALGACNSIATTVFAEKDAAGLEKISIDLEGDLDSDGWQGINPDVRPGYQEVRMAISAKAKDPEKARAAIELAEMRCPVSDCVRNPVPLKVTSISVE